MIFNSLSFIIFLIIVFASYFLCPKKYAHFILLIASYIFYMWWNAKLVFLILGTTLISYFGALIISKYDSPKIKKASCIISVSLCLGVLIFFKYINFMFQSIHDLLNLCNVNNDLIFLNLILPVGISFYTFQTLSYVIDVYKGKLECEKNPFYFALYVSFFPQLVAGPIERPENLLPQLHDVEGRTIKKDNLIIGLKIMLCGFVKKVVIADLVGIYANKVFNNLNDSNGLLIIVGAILFSIQILCDFSGYSDIAIGVAKLFNINLMENFKKPYSSTSIKEFWGRWHISLSTWFRDYLYIPLGGNRKGQLRWALNILIVFLVSGLWHGAAYTFLIWGLLHALYQIIGKFTLPYRNKILEKMHININSIGVRIYRMVITFILVAFAFISFRCSSIEEVLIAYKNLFTSYHFSSSYFASFVSILDLTLIVGLIGLGLLILFNVIDYIKVLSSKNLLTSILLKASYIVLAWIVIITFIYLQSSDVPSTFIYFQF